MLFVGLSRYDDFEYYGQLFGKFQSWPKKIKWIINKTSRIGKKGPHDWSLNTQTK